MPSPTLRPRTAWSLALLCLLAGTSAMLFLRPDPPVPRPPVAGVAVPVPAGADGEEPSVAGGPEGDPAVVRPSRPPSHLPASLRVRVVDALTGVPLPGSTVRATVETWAWRGVTDGNGIVLFEGLESAEEVRLLATGPLHEEGGWRTVLDRGDNGPWDIRLLPTWFAEGTVRSSLDGSPVSGARILLLEGDRELEVGRTEEDGTFRVAAGCVGGRVEILLDAPGFARRSRTLSLPGDPLQPMPIHVYLDPVGELSGFVRNPEGKPLAGVRVVPRPAIPGWGGNTEGPWDARGARTEFPPALWGTRKGPGETVTGEDGSFRIPGVLLGGHYRLEAERSGVSGRSEPVLVDTATGRGSFTLVLGGAVADGGAAEPGRTFVGFEEDEEPVPPPVAVLAGVIVDGEGRPLKDATLTVDHAEEWRERMAVSRKRRLSSLSGGDWMSHRDSWNRLLDEGGRFRMEVDCEGPWVLVVYEGGWMPRAVFPVPAASEDLRLVVPAPGEVRARFRRGERTPVRLREVRGALLLEGRRVGFHRVEDSGIDEFRLTLPPGRADLSLVFGHDPVEWSWSIEVPSGGTVDLGEVDIAASLPVEGRVVDAAGSPVAGAEVTRVGVSVRGPMDRTDREGKFRLEDVPACVVDLEVEAPGSAPARMRVDARAGAPVLLELPPSGVLRGRVVDGAGLPAVQVPVRVRGADPEIPSMWFATDLRGLFTAVLPAGPVEVLAFTDGIRDPASPAGRGAGVVVAGRETEVVVRVP